VLTLRGAYTLATFQADVATMRTRYDAVKAGERAASDGRGARDELLDQAYDRMIQYRQRLPLTLEPDDPLLASMPKVTPSPGGGSGPAAPVLTGDWNAASQFAALDWTPYDDPNLQDYQPWFTPGPTFDQATATSITPTGPSVTDLNTIEGLTNPGDTATYRIYAILSTGEQIASNDLTITRP
jgi:hypothetical protein